MKQVINKKILYFLLGILVLCAAAWPVIITKAEEDQFIVWGDTSKPNRVNVSVKLLENERLDDITTLQIRFYLNGQDVSDAAFVFNSSIKENKEITVKDFRYNSAGQTLTVYLSGRDVLLKKGIIKDLGYIEVDANSDVEIIVTENSSNLVDMFHEQSPVVELGATTSYNMYLKTNEPETTEPETTGSVTTEPETTTASSDQETDSSYEFKNWTKNGSVWKLEKLDGSYATNEWMIVDGKWYWFGSDSIMATGWVRLNDTWYYLGKAGDMKTGWIKDNNQWYYAGSSGGMKTGWIMDKTMWYYLDPDGSMRNGWVEDKGKWYYMAEDGSMLTNATTPDGYQVDRNGVRISK